MGINWTDEELKEADINKRKLTKLVRLLEEAGELADELKVTIFGHNGSGVLYHQSRLPWANQFAEISIADESAIVAEIEHGKFDGGDP